MGIHLGCFLGHALPCHLVWDNHINQYRRIGNTLIHILEPYSSHCGWSDLACAGARDPLAYLCFQNVAQINGTTPDNNRIGLRENM